MKPRLNEGPRDLRNWLAILRVRYIENFGLTNLQTWNNQNVCHIARLLTGAVLFCFFVVVVFVVVVFCVCVRRGFNVFMKLQHLVFKARRTNFSGSHWPTAKQGIGLKTLASYNFYHRKS